MDYEFERIVQFHVLSKKYMFKNKKKCKEQTNSDGHWQRAKRRCLKNNSVYLEEEKTVINSKTVFLIFSCPYYILGKNYLEFFYRKKSEKRHKNAVQLRPIVFPVNNYTRLLLIWELVWLWD